MCRGQLVQTIEDALRIGHVTQGEVIRDSLLVQRARTRWVDQERLQLRREGDSTVIRPAIVERLFSKAIAGKEQRVPISIPEREREHPVEAADAVCAPLLPGVN